MPADCLRWNGRSFEVACVDDMCNNTDRTLCGLVAGHDFADGGDLDWDDDEWDDDEEALLS